jgi:hypothetical protein
MDNKHSFWTLVNKYSKIEIPILQRDYAQGRKTSGVARIRIDFVNYLLDSLLNNKSVELDFVYGSIATNNVFIPLDGQQRLTTLFILHWYLAAKENRLNEVKEILKRFTYETRPSAHDFCQQLLSCEYSDNLKEDICDRIGFNDEWQNDPTVVGMLKMIETLQQQHKKCDNVQDSLLDRLIDKCPVITFYFIPLEKFGLTEELYIRMNARGKILNDFEKFKSEFYKIIESSNELYIQFKDKIEYDWVESLWDFRDEEKYIVDSAFMNYLGFITEMLYFKQSEGRNSRHENFETKDLINFEILKDVFKEKEDNLKFLIFSFDSIAMLRDLRQEIFWEEESKSLGDVIENIFEGESSNDNTYRITLYSAIRYLFVKKLTVIDADFPDFIRVIRNLTYNTPDKSRREWARIFNSIENLITDKNIYLTLTKENADSLMEGFRVSQRDEEIFKSHIIINNPQAKDCLFRAENHDYLRGNITGLIRAAYAGGSDEIEKIELKKCDPADFQNDRIEKLIRLLDCYCELSNDDFDSIWGDFIITSLYTQNQWRLTWDENYKKHNAAFQMVFDFYEKRKEVPDMSSDNFAIYKEKEFIKTLIKENTLSENNKKIREQLYLYYILTVRIMNRDIYDFFRNKYNFGWLGKTTGFKSIFNGTEDSTEEYKTKSPIFQTYSSQFRYSSGLQEKNALPPEIVSEKRIRDPFDQLLNWSKE